MSSLTEEQKKAAKEELEAAVEILEEIYLKYGLVHTSMCVFVNKSGKLASLVTDIDKDIDFWRIDRETQK